MISILGSKCSECGCKDNKHKLKDSYITKVLVTKYRQVVKYKIDENAQQSEEQKK